MRTSLDLIAISKCLTTYAKDKSTALKTLLGNAGSSFSVTSVTPSKGIIIAAFLGSNEPDNLEGIKQELLRHPDASGLDSIRDNEVTLSHSAIRISDPGQPTISASLIVVLSNSPDYEDIGNKIKGLDMNRDGLLTNYS